MTGYHQQQNGYNGGGQLDNNFGHGGWGDGHRGGRQGNNFGQGGWGNGYSQNRGGQQESAQAYKSQVFNEPDRYGYDYTIPGATVHYLMYKKRKYYVKSYHYKIKKINFFKQYLFIIIFILTQQAYYKL